MVDKTLPRKLNIGQHVKKRCKANSPTSHILEELVIVSASLPIFHISRTTHIRDGMALLQSLNARIYSNLGELAMELGQKSAYLLSVCLHCQVVLRPALSSGDTGKNQL